MTKNRDDNKDSAPPPAAHILVVDDHIEIRDLVSRALLKDGFRVSTAADGNAMRQALVNNEIDLIVLDLMMPGDDGLTLCREVRSRSDIPIIMLTARSDEIDKVVGLELGADDYLGKPFGSRELVARIRAVLRRKTPGGQQEPAPQPRIYAFERWKLDVDARELIGDDGVSVALSTGEYDLLMAFAEHPRRVLNRDQLLDLARGRQANLFDRSIDTQVSRLRRKLELNQADPRIIKTVWGGGYLFAADVTRL
ncbi:response regulator [Mycoplana rhizolycopersici]|jgi:two-component system OmpR family response regulator|uniref:Response regulator n=1 Tax=Mycoplana rhizolycopersici TaxID=2746702 RepID=A0ABX2QKB1_9HYPH|nr:response regulator [Rhizobium rhizolycopersici]NVP57806.1 response regulator [Rhizobium rhizolycopersici]